MEHVGLETLERGLEEVRRSPSDLGLIELIVRRPAENERELLAEAMIDPASGLIGDCWPRKASSASADGGPHPDAQLTLMNSRFAALVARDPERRPLAGDQLFVDLDLSEANVPPGTRLQVGSAMIEVTALPHRGCGKFTARFGVDAAKFVNSKVGRAMNLRGVNARVLEGGIVRVGDLVAKSRPAGAPSI